MKSWRTWLAEWNRERVFPIAVAVAAMALWRFLPGKMSNRYWAAVWIPLLLLATYALYFRFFGVRISRMLCAILVLVFLGKDFHLNWNDRNIPDAAAAVRLDAQKYGRAFLAESYGSYTMSQISFYSGLSGVESTYWRDIADLRRSAEGLYDVCYFIALESDAKHRETRAMLRSVGAELFCKREKDMHKKKRLYIYRFPVAPQKAVLPVTGEIWPNGGFEKISQRKGYSFPESYFPIFGAALTDEAVSGKHAIRFRNSGMSFVYTSLVPPPREDGTILFTVRSKRSARLTFSIWKFDAKGSFISRDARVDAVLPDTEITHQFQVPYRARDYAGVAQIRCYWTVCAPYGLILDDFGVFRP